MSFPNYAVLWGVTLYSLFPAPAVASQHSGAALLEAARNDDAAGVARLLAQGASVNTADDGGETALAWSVMRCNRVIAELLLAHGANPNFSNELGVTPLYVAITNNSLPLVTLLLNHRADANVARVDGETPLMIAARSGLTEIMTALLNVGADVNLCERHFRQTALMWAVGHPGAVRLLLKHEADVHAASKAWDITASVYLPVVRTIGNGGSQWNTDGEYTIKQGGQNALHFAVQKHDLESARLLLDAGVDVNVRSADGTTPLLASLYDWDSTGKPLIAGPANAPGSSARFSADIAMAQLLLDRGAKVDVVDGCGYTPLHGAVLAVSALRKLSGNRLTESQSEKPANTPVAPVARDPKLAEALQLVKRLLDAGADPNRPTLHPTVGPVGDVRINPAPPGSSPLHLAADSGCAQLIDVLLAAGGDPNLVRKDGHTPFSVSVLSGNLTVVERLVARGADLRMRYNPIDRFGDADKPAALPRRNQTIMHIAAAAGVASLIPYLYSVGAPLNERNSSGETPLELADHQERFREAHAREVAQLRGSKSTITRDTATTSAIKALLAR